MTLLDRTTSDIKHDNDMLNIHAQNQQGFYTLLRNCDLLCDVTAVVALKKDGGADTVSI